MKQIKSVLFLNGNLLLHKKKVLYLSKNDFLSTLKKVLIIELNSIMSCFIYQLEFKLYYSTQVLYIIKNLKVCHVSKIIY